MDDNLDERTLEEKVRRLITVIVHLKNNSVDYMMRCQATAVPLVCTTSGTDYGRTFEKKPVINTSFQMRAPPTGAIRMNMNKYCVRTRWWYSERV